LLILVIGRATKIQDLLMAEEKEYEGVIRLGATTTTQDRQGEVLESKPVPELTREQIVAAFDQYKGDFQQLPPMVSAIKQDGVPLYKLARQGIEVERKLRAVTVFHYEIQDITLPDIKFRVVCSKGFYVRTYAHDIGQVLGCGAHLQELRRTRSGKFSVDGQIDFATMKEASRDDVKARMLSLRDVSKLRGA
jgi:tRNA pseudouridine55 synthase